VPKNNRLFIRKKPLVSLLGEIKTKTNVQLLVWSFAVIPFAAATVAVLCSLEQNDSAKQKLGPVDLGVMSQILGGSTEGGGCYRKINSDCGGSGGNPDRSCPAFASSCGFRIKYYALYLSRSKGLLELPNSNIGQNVSEQICYESKACEAVSYLDKEYNENSSNPGCVPKNYMICYSCSNPSLSNPTTSLKSDYRCNDP
jgi:hypothetical protein